MNIRDQSIGSIEYDKNGLPVGIDQISEMLRLEYINGNLTEDTKNYYISYIQSMMKEKEKDENFSDELRSLFKNAASVEEKKRRINR